MAHALKTIRFDNIKLISELPKHEYNMLLQSCDIGMIFLDKRFTVPNFPSRILSYLEYKMPVLASTDKATDLGKTIMDNRFGLWSESGDISATDQNLGRLVNDPGLRLQMGLNGFDYFLNNYTVSHSYDIIVNHFK